MTVIMPLKINIKIPFKIDYSKMEHAKKQQNYHLI